MKKHLLKIFKDLLHIFRSCQLQLSCVFLSFENKLSTFSMHISSFKIHFQVLTKCFIFFIKKKLFPMYFLSFHDIFERIYERFESIDSKQTDSAQ